MTATQILNLMTVAGLIAMMLSMGFKVTIDQVVTSICQPRQIVAGLLANFVFVPGAAIGLLYLFAADHLVSVGFLILAVCPGAPMGPPFVSIAKGDVPYATGQMVVLAGLSAFVAPILLSGLLPRLLPAGELQIDYLAIVRTLLVSQMIPLAVGLCLHHWSPKVTTALSKPVGLLANLLLLGVLGIILIREYESLAAIRMRGWCGMLLLLAASLIVGWMCGGPGRATRTALAITTGVRNAAVALVIVSANFADTPAVTAVVAYALISIFVTFGCAFLLGAVTERGRLS